MPLGLEIAEDFLEERWKIGENSSNVPALHRTIGTSFWQRNMPSSNSKIQWKFSKLLVQKRSHSFPIQKSTRISLTHTLGLNGYKFCKTVHFLEDLWIFLHIDGCLALPTSTEFIGSRYLQSTMGVYVKKK